MAAELTAELCRAVSSRGGTCAVVIRYSMGIKMCMSCHTLKVAAVSMLVGDDDGASSCQLPVGAFRGTLQR